MNRLLNTLASDSCCVYSWVRFYVMPQPPWYVASKVGVTERTVYNWRRSYKSGKLPCCFSCETRYLQEKGD